MDRSQLRMATAVTVALVAASSVTPYLLEWLLAAVLVLQSSVWLAETKGWLAPPSSAPEVAVEALEVVAPEDAQAFFKQQFALASTASAPEESECEPFTTFSATAEEPQFTQFANDQGSGVVAEILETESCSLLNTPELEPTAQPGPGSTTDGEPGGAAQSRALTL